MTKIIKSIGASSPYKEQWESISWKEAKKQVRRLQMRIAKAGREGRLGKAKALQRLLTHSYYGKALAVKRVTQNKGKSTPGVDKVIWSTSVQKMKAILSLKRKGYKPLPLKRIYIPKKSGGKRPLSIATFYDRAMQALYLLALEPLSENRADRNSYGFRPKRSAKDAIEQCHICLSKKKSAKWVFEGDIEKCFDNINHDWLIKNIPMDKEILSKFLKAGYMEKSVINPTTGGTPQGGIISPTLAVMTLSGLEERIRSQCQKRYARVNVITYADDFIITATKRDMLEPSVIPTVKEFLLERGLTLSEKKSRITHIEDGFDFLGFNIRKYKNGKLLTKPSKDSVKTYLKDLRRTIKRYCSAKTENLIYLLNPKIRGWGNYFRSVVSSKIFSKIDDVIYRELMRWINRRHPNKGRRWRVDKYFRKSRYCNWQFFAKDKDKTINLLKMKNIHIKRHCKIISAANPYDPEYKEYFIERDKILRYQPDLKTEVF